MAIEACPICGKAAGEGRLAPFCSRRCADVDLGRWFVGAYAVPTAETEEDALESAEEEGE